MHLGGEMDGEWWRMRLGWSEGWDRTYTDIATTAAFARHWRSMPASDLDPFYSSASHCLFYMTDDRRRRTWKDQDRPTETLAKPPGSVRPMEWRLISEYSVTWSAVKRLFCNRVNRSDYFLSRVNSALMRVVKYNDSLPWAVRKRLNRSRCGLECWGGWVQGTDTQTARPWSIYISSRLRLTRNVKTQNDVVRWM